MKYLMISVELALLLPATAVRAQQQPAGAPAATTSSELECRVLTGRVTDPQPTRRGQGTDGALFAPTTA